MSDGCVRTVVLPSLAHAFLIAIALAIPTMESPPVGAQEPAHPAPILLSGSVTSSDPVEFSSGQVHLFEYDLEMESWRPSSSLPIGPDGSFRGEAPAADLRWVIIVPGRLPGLGSIETTAGNETSIEVALEAGRSVTMRVVDAQGAPIEGASVRWSLPWSETEWDLLRSVSLEPGRTDAKGRVRIDGLPPGDIRLSAEHPHHLPGEWPIEGLVAETPPTAEEPGELELALRDARWLVATVSESIPVTLLPTEEQGRFWYRIPPPTPSDSTGIRPGTWIRSIPIEPQAGAQGIDLPGLTTMTVSWPSGTGPFDLGELAITLGNVVVVSVTAVDGAPVAGASVAIDPRHRVSSCGFVASGWAPAAPTDETGRVRFSAVEGGAHRLRVEAAGFVIADSEFEVASPQTTLAIQLERCGWIRGRLPPLEDPWSARVAIGDPAADPDLTEPFLPHRDGTFRIPVRPGRRFELRYCADGAIPGRIEDLQVEAGQVLDVGFLTPDPGHRLQGVVVDEAGAPIHGVHFSVGGVELQDPSVRGLWGPPAIIVDETGAFDSTGFLPGRYTYSVFGAGLLDGRTTLDVPAELPMRILLRRGVSHVGAIVRSDGSPYPARGIALFSEESAQVVRIEAYQNGRFLDATVEGGSYEIAGLAEGEVRLDVQAGSNIRRSFRARRPSLLPPRIVLPMPASVAVEIRSAEIEREPSESVFTVHCIDRAGRTTSFHSGGPVTLPARVEGPGLEPGPYTIIVGGLGWLSTTPFSVELGEGQARTLQVSLAPAAPRERIELLVLDSEGAPAPGAWWHLYDIYDGAALDSGQTSESGRSVISYHPGTAGWLEVGGVNAVRNWFEDPIGRAERGLITVRVSGMATLRVGLNEAGLPWRGSYRVLLIPLEVATEEPDLWFRLFAPSGSERLQHARAELPTGRYELLVVAGDSAEDEIMARREVRLLADEKRELDIELPPHLSVSGSVRVEGVPADGEITAEMRIDGRRYRSTTTVAGGEFQLSLARSGSFTFAFEDELGVTRRLETEVTEGQTLVLEY